MKELWSRDRTIYILFLVLTFLLYGNTLKNKYSLDDEYVTVTNFPENGKNFVPNHKLVSKGFRGIPEIWKSRYAHDSEGSFDYRPVTSTTFAIEYGIFGQNPFISHLINLLLYFVCICILFVILREIFSQYENGFSIALLCSLLFLIHPVHSEVVNNIKSRDELLSFLFSISALWYSLAAYKKLNFKNIVLIVLFLALGLFSKQSSALFIAIIPLFLFFFKKPELKKLAVIAVSLIVVYFLLPIIRNNLVTEKEIRLFYHFENPLYEMKVSFFQKIIIALKTFGFYVKFLIFPYPFRNYYGANTFDLTGKLNFYFFTGIAFIISCATYLYKTKSKTFLFGLLLFCGSILPFLNFFSPAPGIIAERFLFVPSLGFCLLLSLVITPYLKFEKQTLISGFFKKPIIYFSFVIALCTIYTLKRNSNWYNKLTLFEHDISYLKESAKANSLIANEYFELLRNPNPKYPIKPTIEKTLAHYNLAIKNDSGIYTAYNNAGVVYYSYLNDLKNAEKYFLLAIRHKEKYAQAMENLGNVYKAMQKCDTAIKCYIKAYGFYEKQSNAPFELTNCLIFQKKYSQALSVCNYILSIYPQNYSMWVQKGNCYVNLKNIPDAVSSYEMAYKINPNNELGQYITSLSVK